MSDFRNEFIAFCIDCGVLRFGQFKTKAGRMSPYFFNAGLFNDGAMLGRLGQFYAKALHAAGHPFDMLFGPAYKGIPLAASVAIGSPAGSFTGGATGASSARAGATASALRSGRR